MPAIKRPATGWRTQRTTTHPGVILREDFMTPLNITANRLALQTRMPATRIGEVLHGRRAISPDTALRLARYFGTSAEFWLNLQSAHDLSKARLELEAGIVKDIQPLGSRRWKRKLPAHGDKLTRPCPNPRAPPPRSLPSPP